MKKTIFNVYVEIESQEQADRMKQLCIDNGFEIHDKNRIIDFRLDRKLFYHYEFFLKSFCISNESFLENQKKATEREFINLLKETK